MDEKILIQSKHCNAKKLLWIFAFIGLILTVVITTIVISGAIDDYDWAKRNFAEHKQGTHCTFGDSGTCNQCKRFLQNPDQTSYITAQFLDGDNILLLVECLVPFVVFTIVGLILYLWLKSYNLTVTDKRIYGQIANGERVDLPIDSISATARSRFWKGIYVSTSSGKIQFRMIKNADEVYTVINNLLIERQQSNVAPVVAVTQSDEADKLKKYKELLDSGIITQEEFDAKKKQLLGL